MFGFILVSLLVIAYFLAGDPSFLLVAFILSVVNVVYIFIKEEIKIHDEAISSLCSPHEWVFDEKQQMFCKKCKVRP